MIMANETACRKEEHYCNAEKFEPERWLEDGAPKLDLLAASPFSITHQDHFKNYLSQFVSLFTAKVPSFHTLTLYYTYIHNSLNQ
jgi:hypothetical protein